MSTETQYQEALNKFIGTPQEETTDAPATESVEQEPAPVAPAASDDTPAAPEPAAAPVVAEPDYNKFIGESSGGLFKSVDEFKNSVEKFKNYDTVVSERDALKAKTEENPFTNDLSKQFNELLKKGSNADQIEAFLKLNKLGDLNALDPFDARVNRMVLVDGISPEAARRLVNKEFDLNVDLDDATLSEEEKAELQTKLSDSKEMLRVASKDDLSKLEQYKAKITEPVSVPDPKEEALKQQAIAAEHSKNVKAAVPAIFAEIKGIGDVSFGDNDKLNFDFSDDYKATVAGKLETYLNHTVDPITPEKIKEAKAFIDADYKVSHFESAVKAAYEHGLNKGREQQANEYNNPNGLNNPEQPTAGADEANIAFLRSIAQGQEA